ncbi:MAG: glycosyltransferase, partial [Pseudomonadota bacterium]
NEFIHGDKTILLIKTSPRGPQSISGSEVVSTTAIVESIVANIPNAPAIRLVDAKISQYQIDNIHNIGHVFVSTSRCEGWGLSIFEACGFGNPVICGRFGGQTDFLDQSPNDLLDGRKTEAFDPMNLIQGGVHWMEFDTAVVSRSLRQTMNQYKERKKRAGLYAKTLEPKYGEARIGELLDPIMTDSS